ncbi:MAG: N5-glutamine methyltransferase family protein, partial [Acidobacteriaceae bacterium]
EAAIARLNGVKDARVADVGTGSGAIAVALAHSLLTAEIVALDISPAALAVASENAKQNGVVARIRFVESDLLSAVADERFDAIVSNPPYVAFSERSTLPVEVREYEPEQALFAGPTGLEMYRRLIPDALPLLVPGGWLLMEIGHGQKSAIEKLLLGWDAVEFVPDLQGIPRVAIARKG